MIKKPATGPARLRRAAHPVLAVSALCLVVSACSSPATATSGPSSSAAPAAAASHSSQASASPTTLTPVTIQLALVPPKMVFMGFYVAKAEGFFTRNGLNVTLQAQPTGNQAVRGLAAGAGVFAAGGTDALAAADAQGGNLACIWDYATDDLSIIGSSNVKTLKDLKGKTIGITDKSGPAYTLPVLALASAGLPASAAKYVVLGGRPALVTALASGKIQAAAFHTDDGLTLIKKDPSVHVLAQMSSVVPKWWYGAVAVKRDYAKAHPQVVEHLLTALVEAQRWMYTNSKQTIALSVKYTQEDPSVVAKAYSVLVKNHNWVTGSGIDPAAVNFTLTQFKKDGVIPSSSSLKASDIIDNSYIQAALKNVSSS